MKRKEKSVYRRIAILEKKKRGDGPLEGRRKGKVQDLLHRQNKISETFRKKGQCRPSRECCGRPRNFPERKKGFGGKRVHPLPNVGQRGRKGGRSAKRRDIRGTQ